jgi:hypothetical protein
MRSARVVEQVLIQLSGHYFSLRENHGQEWIRTTEGVSQRIYSPPRLATSVPTRRLVSQRRPWSYWAGASAKRGWMVIDFITIFANGKSLLSVG